MTNTKKYQQILEEIRKINPDTQVLAVSKLQTIEKMKILYHQGHRHFAENYVQEALEKISSLKDLDIHWHLIGHLQKNKVKYISGLFHQIHSVDSIPLAEIINRKSLELGQIQRVLLQVNFAKEESKQGFALEQLDAAIPELKKLSGIDVVGIMTMPPLAENAESSRPYFISARKLRDQLKKDFKNMSELSMGTSSDYLIAAEEGASWVRLGTVLFGERK